MTTLKPLLIACILIGASSGCQGDSSPVSGGPEPGNPDPDMPTLGSSEPLPFDPLPAIRTGSSPLRKVRSCDDIRESLRQNLQEIVDALNARYAECVAEAQKEESLFSTPLSCPGIGGYYYTDYLMREGDLLSLDSTVSVASSGEVTGGVRGGEPPPVAGVDYSTTNVQEGGVDEADLVKTDGEYIYLVSGGKLVILAARPAESTRILSETGIEGAVGNIYLRGDRVVVFSSGYRVVARTKKGASSRRSIRSGSYPSSYFYRPLTKLTLLDVSDRSTPQVLRETYIEGDYSTSRMIGGRVILVLGLPNFNPAEMIGFDPTRDDPYFVGAYALEVDRYAPRMRDKIMTSSDPVVNDSSATDCSRYFLPLTDDAGQGFIGVYSYPVDDAHGEIGRSAVVGYPGITYASKDSLYITQTYYPVYYRTGRGLAPKAGEVTTSIHKFDLSSDPVNPVYLASGTVEGTLLNQFSLGEYRGLLRVATLVGQAWGTGEWEPKNNVFVLQVQEDVLAVVGEVRGFAPGETIYSARFIADAGYVVTFRQTDPLFIVDLKEPTAPKLAGKLEMPGFSTYLHPMDATHLLAIGRDGTETGRSLGLALFMFDVSDLANPTRAYKYNIPGSSSAAYNHLAFNYFAPKEMLALPIQGGSSYSARESGYGFAGFNAYKVTIGSGFELMGNVDHSDLCPATSTNSYNYCYVSPTRSIIIKDDLYTLSTLGVKVNPLSDYTKSSASVALPVPPSRGYEYLPGGVVSGVRGMAAAEQE